MADTLYLEKFGQAFVPKKFRSELKNFLFKAGIDQVPYKYFGLLFWVTLVLTYLIYFSVIFKAISDMNSMIILVVTFLAWFIIQTILSFLIIMGVYVYLTVQIYNRTKIIEGALPDYLTLVSTNLKGGLSFEKSLWAAIKPEFGILAKEVTLVSKKVLTGNDVKESLEELSNKYNSPILRRSLNLIIGELESGGRIVEVIDRVISNLKKSTILKQEMEAATVTYTIFMVAIVVFITPALFALSQQLLEIIIGVTQQLGGSAGSTALPIKIGEASIKPSDFRTFSITAMIIISTFSAMIVSIISRGNVKGGLKFIPLFIIATLTLFFIASAVLGSLFGQL
ncbi:type II secretion system F family protein [archaeon]|nr:type II secretion system F family protein [archaeon]MBL7057037.1 type II secretion system F family protein [Candidatus Woesearchaeota archaeon]